MAQNWHALNQMTQKFKGLNYLNFVLNLLPLRGHLFYLLFDQRQDCQCNLFVQHFKELFYVFLRFALFFDGTGQRPTNQLVRNKEILKIIICFDENVNIYINIYLYLLQIYINININMYKYILLKYFLLSFSQALKKVQNIFRKKKFIFPPQRIIYTTFYCCWNSVKSSSNEHCNLENISHCIILFNI